MPGRQCPGRRNRRRYCSSYSTCPPPRRGRGCRVRGIQRLNSKLGPMTQAADRPVVLCVDDAEDILSLMAKALRSDYFVLTAADAGSALERAAGNPRPDLILLDVEMPGASGFDVCRVLKSEGNTADIPVVFLTANEEARGQVEGLELGAVDYITSRSAQLCSRRACASTSPCPASATSSSAS